MFSKDMVPQLWTHNSIHFPADRKIMLVAALVTDMLIMQVSINPVLSTLSEVIPTMNFLNQESQQRAVNSSVHLVSKISFTIKRLSYIKWVSLKPQVLVYTEKDACPLTFKFEEQVKIASPGQCFTVVRASACTRFDPWPWSGACAGSNHLLCLSH